MQDKINFRVVVLSIVLTAVLGAANAYLGLFAGMTISASIPSAVMAMVVFRALKRGNILESNLVQTAASSGEALAAGAIFTLPALIMLGYWQNFTYLQTTTVVLCGGILGVVCSIPLRRIILSQQELKFPEGVATAEVLQSGQRDLQSARYLFEGCAIGAAVKLCESGLHLWSSSAEYISTAFNRVSFYFGVNLSAALLGVGYIVGFNIGVLVFLGGAISWWVAVPCYLSLHDIALGDNYLATYHQVWRSEVRYLGVGAMLVGGIWALLKLRSTLVAPLTRLFSAKTKFQEPHYTEKDRDISPRIVAAGFIVSALSILLLYWQEIGIFSLSFFATVIAVIAAMLFSVVAAYLAGMVGSSNNPVSGVTVATVLCSALLLNFFFPNQSAIGAATAIFISAVVCCAAAISGDNIQDLKCGQLVGSTPYRQQWMELLGVVVAALVMAPILTLLNSAYGFGPASVTHPKSLSAPQATLMKSVAEGVFGGTLPWPMIYTGAAIAVCLIIGDEVLRRRGAAFRLPVLAVAIGLYLPFELGAAIFAGAIISGIASRFKNSEATPGKNESGNGVLFSAGLITGEALLGILLAVPIVISGRSDFLKLTKESLPSLGLLVFAALGLRLWVVAKQSPAKQTHSLKNN